MKNYQEWYDKRKSSLLRHPQLLQLMRVFNRMMTVLMPLAYLTLLGTNFVSKGVGKELSAYILVPALGFLLLTLVRKWINQPRPYEAWELSRYWIRTVLGIQCLVAMSFRQPLFPWLACMQICLWGWFYWSYQLFSVLCES